MEQQTKQRKYYKIDEKVFYKSLKIEAIIKGLNIVPKSDSNPEGIYDAVIEFKDDLGITITTTVNLWDIGKIPNKDKSNNKPQATKRQKDVLIFAKVRPDAIIPSKDRENAGYDLYANLGKNQDELRLYKDQANLVPTGIASSMSSKYYLNLKHERGITGSVGMSILSGVVDSGYRGEIFVNIVPTWMDVIISKTYQFPPRADGKLKPIIDTNLNVIFYPYSLAIAQATLDVVPDVEVEEATYEELKKIPSKRGDGKLGSSGK